MSNPALFFDDWQAPTPLVIPVSNCAQMILNIYTRNYNGVIVWGDSTKTDYDIPKNVDAIVNNLGGKSKGYSPNFTGDIKVYLKGGLKDVYSYNFRNSTIGTDFHQQYNIQNLGLFLAQMPNLYSYYFSIYAYGSANRQPTIIGDFAQNPDSVERIRIDAIDVKNIATALVLNFNNFKNTSKLKWFRKEYIGNSASMNALRFLGDIAKIPPLCTHFYISEVGNYSVETNSAITYTSGKVWPSSFDTLQIPLVLTTPELDNLLIDMDNSITTKIGDGLISLYGYRSSVSDTSVASLQSKGFTVNVNKYSITPIKILDLDFQNNFIDTSSSSLTLVSGGSSNLPTFALSGRKQGEYCAVFNGSQSIKTTTNLPVNSDKVTIAFWMKTTQTSTSTMIELSSNYTGVNGFAMFLNDLRAGKIELGSGTSSVRKFVDSSNNVNSDAWVHIVGVIDRAVTPTSVKIYVNGIDVTTLTSINSNNTGNFANNILFIGQRAGSTAGFIGSLTRLKIYNYPLAPSEVSNLYNSEL